MAVTIYTLSNVAANVSGSNVTITGVLVSNVAWKSPITRQRVQDRSNPNFIRQLQASPDGVLASRPGTLFGIQMEDIMKIAYACVPGLTWPPAIETQPANVSVVHPNSASFSVSISTENNISATYKWQSSTDGSNFSNISDGGVYANSATSNLSISNTTGMNGYSYRCAVTNVAGLVYSDAATLTVT